MLLGKIVKSNSHLHYLCQVYAPGEIDETPQPEDYAYGRFVRIAVEARSPTALVGLVHDTFLVDPDFGRLGPRLSPDSELSVFSPDYLNEKVTLVGVLAIGLLREGEPAVHGVPELAARIGAEVKTMTDADVLAFHSVPRTLRLAYVPLVISQAGVLAPHLVEVVLTRLKAICPEQHLLRLIDLLADDLAWGTQIRMLGGE